MGVWIVLINYLMYVWYNDAKGRCIMCIVQCLQIIQAETISSIKESFDQYESMLSIKWMRLIYVKWRKKGNKNIILSMKGKKYIVISDVRFISFGFLSREIDWTKKLPLIKLPNAFLTPLGRNQTVLYILRRKKTSSYIVSFSFVHFSL